MQHTTRAPATVQATTVVAGGLRWTRPRRLAAAVATLRTTGALAVAVAAVLIARRTTTLSH